MKNKVILHTSHCPRCKVVEMKLKQKGIQYEENTDVQVMLDLGMKSAPALEVDGKLMGFTDAVNWINQYEG